METLHGNGDKVIYDGNCKSCGGHLRCKSQFSEHIRNDEECPIYYKLYYRNPKYCTSEGRNAIRNTDAVLEKRHKYHCRLTNWGNDISINNDGEQFINSMISHHRGLPK